MPNRPGTLGAVASALGGLGADINLIEIVEKRGEVDAVEFILELPPTQTVGTLVAACDRLDSVQVEWVRNYPRGGGIEHDIELHRRITAEPARAGEIVASVIGLSITRCGPTTVRRYPVIDIRMLPSLCGARIQPPSAGRCNAGARPLSR
jgi:hypothetical protein